MGLLHGVCEVSLTHCICNNTSETQRYYSSNCLKKPNTMPIRQFVKRVQQLNGYPELVPCLLYSPQTTKFTKKLGPFEDQDLASHFLECTQVCGKPITTHQGHGVLECL